MTQEITVTNVGDHHEMTFDGGNSYPVPTNAIDTLDDDLTPTEKGESVTFRGDYGGHKHCKTFDVEEVVDGLDDDDDVEDEMDESDTDTGEESDEDDDVSLHERVEVGDRVTNDTEQGQSSDYEVVGFEELATFGDPETAVVVQRVGRYGDLKGKPEEISERRQSNWSEV